jgi:hypothetical protein
MLFTWGKGLAAVALVAVAAAVWGQEAATGPTAELTVAQIVERMQDHDLAQQQRLKQYRGLRQYHVEYTGFAADVAAQMEVEVTYDAGSGKSFRIVSQSGSKILAEKVLKRAVDSEKEASRDKKSTALTPANYKFSLAGTESLGGRAAYKLDVEPLVGSKFLYRGRIWVDATDFAVMKTETAPAKNPSFWISRTLIHYTASKTDGFWMPLKMRSETKVRLGGTAVLTIDYGSYRISAE